MSKIFEKVIEFVNIIIYFYHLLYYVINYEVSKIISAGLCKIVIDTYLLQLTIFLEISEIFRDWRFFGDLIVKVVRIFELNDILK